MNSPGMGFSFCNNAGPASLQAEEVIIAQVQKLRYNASHCHTAVLTLCPSFSNLDLDSTASSQACIAAPLLQCTSLLRVCHAP